MSGKEYLVYISSDGTELGTKTEIEYQGDLVLNFNRQINRTDFKNGSKSSQANGGITGSFDIGEEAPVPAGHVLVWDAHDNDGDCYLWIEGTKTGAQTFAGLFKLAINNKNMPNEGEVTHSVEFSENGTITRGAVP